MTHDPTVWLGASLAAYAVAVNAAWWAVAHGPADRAARVAAGLAAARWLYLGGLPLAAVALGVAPLWLAGWIRPSDPLAALGGALVAGLAGAAAIVGPWRAAAARTAAPRGPAAVPFDAATVGRRAADVVLHEAHWGLVRAGVVAAAPGAFALPGGTLTGIGQLAVAALLLGELLAHPWLRHRALDAQGAWPVARLGVAAAASHLGWTLGGTAAAGLAAHAVVVAAVVAVETGAVVGRFVPRPNERPRPT